MKEMEVLLYFSELDDDGPISSSFSAEEEARIRKISELDDKSTTFSMVNIGPGADFFVVLSTILLVKDFIMLAPSVLEGLDSWKVLIGKIKRWINKGRLVSGDEEFAKLLALDYLLTHYKYEKLNLIDSHTIKTCDLSFMILNQKGDLPKHPHNYYIQTYQFDDGRTIILGIKSTGEVNLIKAFELDPYGLMEVGEKQCSV